MTDKETGSPKWIASRLPGPVRPIADQQSLKPVIGLFCGGCAANLGAPARVFSADGWFNIEAQPSPSEEALTW